MAALTMQAASGYLTLPMTLLPLLDTHLASTVNKQSNSTSAFGMKTSMHN
jgi:hypothetical protein